MNRDHLLRIQRIFREIFDDASLVITPEFSMQTYGSWDSVATVQIVLAVEQEFECRLPTEAVAKITSVSDIIQHLPK